MMRGFANMLSNSISLDQFVADSIQWSSHDWHNFVNHWKYKEVLKMLPKYRSQIDNVLNHTLNINDHSLPYVYLLGFKSNEKLDDPQSLAIYLQQLNNFIENCDYKKAHVYIYPRPFNECIKFLVDYYKKSSSNDKIFTCLKLIPKLKKSIKLLQGYNEQNQSINNSILTSIHSDLMQCCAESFCYHLAEPEINHDLITVQGNGCVRSIDNLKYHYFAAYIFIAIKNYPKALELLVLCCTAPSESISMIQIEAYKKYILICLILKQKFISLPKYTPRILSRYFPKFCNEYLELVNHFNQGISVVNKIIEKYADIYTKDYNFGLVRQVLVSLEKNAVKKLTSVYTRLSIEKVYNLCGCFNSVESAKKILILMIKNNELSASIDKDGVVTFNQNNNFSMNDKELLHNMQERIKYVLDLWNNLDLQQLDIKTDRKYILKSLNLPTADTENTSTQQMIMQSVMGALRHGM